MVWVVNDRRIGAYQHQMIGRRGSSDFREVVVTQRVLPGQREIRRNIRFLVLYFVYSIGVTLFPRLMLVIGIIWWGILCMLEFRAFGTGECPEIVVERVILFNNNDDMVNQVAKCMVHIHKPSGHSRIAEKLALLNKT